MARTVDIPRSAMETTSITFRMAVCIIPTMGMFTSDIIEVSDQNPDRCNHDASCGAHRHGPGCGHEAVPHGDHVDYLVGGRLHHPHGNHCDDHGPLPLA